MALIFTPTPERRILVITASGLRLLIFLIASSTLDIVSSIFPGRFLRSLKLRARFTAEKVKPKPGEKNKQDQVNINITSPRRAAITVLQSGSKLAITSNDAYEYQEGDLIKVEIAADFLEGSGNPFKDYDPFDFNLSSCPLVEEGGCSITANLNKIEITPYSSDFEIVFDGLHPHWGYVTKYKLIRIAKEDLNGESKEEEQS